MINENTSRAVVVFIMLGVVAIAALMSWLTTAVTYDGRMPVGEWTMRIENSDGKALPKACLTILSGGGDVISWSPNDLGEEVKGPFDNYTAPGSVCADDRGLLRLKNTRTLKYGGSYWKLFWIWRIGSDPHEGPRNLLLKISAPGYEAVIVPLSTLFSEKGSTVVLKGETGGQIPH